MKYIYYYLLNNNILEKYYNGSGQKVIAKSKLLEVKLPVPTVEIQKEIINYLDNINSVIENNNMLVELYKNNIKEILKQSYI